MTALTKWKQEAKAIITAVDVKYYIDLEGPLKELEELTKTEIISKLIEEMTSQYIGGLTSRERVKQQLRDKWLNN